MGRVLTPKIRDIAVSTAAKAFDVSPRDIMSDCRLKHISCARQYAMWLLREFGYSFPQIGRGLGRDHTTVISGVLAHQKRVEEDEHIRELVCPQLTDEIGDNMVSAAFPGFANRGRIAA